MTSTVEEVHRVSMSQEPSLDEVRAAARAISGVAIPTPILRSHVLDNLVGAQVLLKMESLQRTGSFKFRGAYNRLRYICFTQGDEVKVVAYSSGNHALAVAEASRLLGICSILLLPADAPQSKMDGVYKSGAEVILYDRWKDDREKIAEALAASHGAVVVPSSDDPGIITGQGTVALEMIEEAERMLLGLNRIVVPVGGGGLLAGTAIASAECPEIEVTGVQNDACEAFSKSLPLPAESSPGEYSMRSYLCDGLAVRHPSKLAFQIARDRGVGMVAVTDEEVLVAMKFAMLHLKVVVEPSGAVGLAALLSGRLDVRGEVVALILSGGNVSAEAISLALR